ncbi:MAG TPA: hypothetical protein VKM94_14580 [Blastocatellia bacterium]|nr:hypothetical protein [Blastocatellia bacterium]
MLFRKRDQQLIERLDQLGRRVTASTRMPDDQVEALASSITYANVRGRIAATTRTDQIDLRSAVLLSARRAIPAMGAVALLVLAWYGASSNEVSAPSLAVAITGAGGIGTQRVKSGGTCAISTSDQCSVSTEDVLATLVKENPR